MIMDCWCFSVQFWRLFSNQLYYEEYLSKNTASNEYKAKGKLFKTMALKQKYFSP